MQNSDTPNALINEASPYLLQHAYNPVQWVAWSQEAFERAKAEDKLVIISIGYSACHWCHVMAHESFEDVQVAKMMNDNFICIKVDREERPDVDQFYMDALILMHSHGGWPLNAVSLPDGRPIYSGTYFTKNQWLGILADLAEGYKRNKAKSLAYAEKLMQGIHTLNLINPPAAEETFSIKLLKEAYLNFAYQYDRTHGGRGRAPKFPMPDNWLFLLRFHHLTQVEDAIPQVNLTLTKMAEGGIYDQIGGGFARYSVDPAWKVPHFEKMLYDNAQLMSVYAEAWQQTKNPLYKRTVYETADFLKRELLSPENGFYASLDADTEGEEGLFYVWRKAEIMDALGDAAPLAIAAFGIDQEAFWEKGNNVLLIAKSLRQLAESFQISEQEVSQRLDEIKTKLFEYRKQRVAPSLDDKIVLAWNALAVKGFVDAYKAFNDKAFFEQAKNTLAFIQENMVKEKQLYRTWKAEAKIPAFLDDYAYYIQALIEIYQVSFDITLLEEAKKMTDAVHEKFSVEDGVMYYYTDINYNEVASRKIDTADQVTASGNSVMANNLFKLGQFYEDQRLLNRSEKMLQYILPQLKDHLAYYSNWGILLCYFIKNYEVVIVGEKALEKRMLLENQFHPLKMVCGSIQGNDKLPLLADKYEEGKTMLYVCHDKRCELPTQDVEIALSQMK